MVVNTTLPYLHKPTLLYVAFHLAIHTVLHHVIFHFSRVRSIFCHLPMNICRSPLSCLLCTPLHICVHQTMYKYLFRQFYYLSSPLCRILNLTICRFLSLGFNSFSSCPRSYSRRSSYIFQSRVFYLHNNIHSIEIRLSRILCLVHVENHFATNLCTGVLKQK
jgi:hypothetical protein